MADETDNFKTVNYRLSCMEKTLTELKNVVLENKLQAKDIKSLETKQDDFTDAINAHDKRLRALEVQPTKEKAEKWQYILDFAFKSALTTIGAIIVSKIL